MYEEVLWACVLCPEGAGADLVLLLWEGVQDLGVLTIITTFNKDWNLLYGRRIDPKVKFWVLLLGAFKV